MTVEKIRKRKGQKTPLWGPDVAGYIETDSSVCSNGAHKIKKGERIRTVYLGRYFFDFCMKHWEKFREQIYQYPDQLPQDRRKGAKTHD